MRAAKLAFALLLLIIPIRGEAKPANSDVISKDAAQRAFDAFQKNCSRDNGGLWGYSLCGGIVIVDPQTRDAIANDGWTGKLPAEIGIANTAFDWRGSRWSMVRWPLPADEGERDRLLLHERFHAIQDKLGIPMAPAATNAHLDTLDGRYLMRMEMRALRDAMIGMKTSRNATRTALANALAYRAERFRKFKGAEESEAALDRSEGMASYTGVKLFSDDRMKQFDAAAKALAAGEKSDAFARDYAYATGPAWGLLMDEFRANWRRVIAQQTIEQLLWRFPLKTEPPQSKEVLDEERTRDVARQQRVKDYVRRFVDGPVLTLPLRQMNMQFDPNDTHAFPEHGTVYERITVTDAWGKIVANKGALINGSFNELTAPAGTYNLTLAPGYRVVPGARKGDLTIEKAQ